MTLLVRVSAIVGVAVTWLLWTAGPASACTVSYQSGSAGEVCGGAMPAVAAGVVATAALVSAVAVVTIKVKSGQAVADLAHFADALSGTAQENLDAFQNEIVRRLTAGDPAIRELYMKDTKPGTVRRKVANTEIANLRLPVVELSSEQMFRVRPPGAPPAIPAVFREDFGGKHGRSGLDDATLADIDELTRLRYDNLKNRSEAVESVRKGPRPDSRFGPDGPGRDDRGGFNHLASLLGERLGEYAGVHAARSVLQGLFPGHTLERLLVGELGGPGTLDDIYRVAGPEGTAGMLVLETKGPEAAQDARYGLDGERYEQGHPEYLNTVIEVMRASGRFGTVPDELANAIEKKTLGYYYVRALVTDDGGGLTHTEMTKARLDEQLRLADDAVRTAREPRPDLTAEEAAEIHRDVRLGGLRGSVAYAGFRIKQFDLGFRWP